MCSPALPNFSAYFTTKMQCHMTIFLCHFLILKLFTEICTICTFYLTVQIHTSKSNRLLLTHLGTGEHN